MSWSIGHEIVGTKNALRKLVEKSSCSGDASQFDAAKAFVLALLDALPDGKLFKLSASGHHSSGDYCSYSLGLQLHLVPTLPEP